MFKCNSCSRSFKTRQALGGHVSRAHSTGSVRAADSPLEPAPKEETIVTQPAPTPKEEVIVEQPAKTDTTVVPAPSKEEGVVEQHVVGESATPALIPAEANEANTISGQTSEAEEIPASKVEEEEEP